MNQTHTRNDFNEAVREMAANVDENETDVLLGRVTAARIASQRATTVYDREYAMLVEVRVTGHNICTLCSAYCIVAYIIVFKTQCAPGHNCNTEHTTINGDSRKDCAVGWDGLCRHTRASLPISGLVEDEPYRRTNTRRVGTVTRCIQSGQ